MYWFSPRFRAYQNYELKANIYQNREIDVNTQFEVSRYLCCQIKIPQFFTHLLFAFIVQCNDHALLLPSK